MDRDQLWQIIDRSREGHEGTQYDRLVALLTALDGHAILDFNRLFCQCVTQAYRWELMAVAEIVNGRTEAAVAFDRFLGWLMAQGRDYFQAALADAARAADRAKPGVKAENPDIWNAACEAYEARTGRDDFLDIADGVSTIMEGERLTDGEIRKRFGDLIERFATP